MLWFALRKEGAGPLEQMPWARGADGVEGPGSVPLQKLEHSLRADSARNGRSVNCPGLLLGPARTPLLALGRLLALSANFLTNALACEGWGAGTESKRPKAFNQDWLKVGGRLTISAKAQLTQPQHPPHGRARASELMQGQCRPTQRSHSPRRSRRYP